GLYAQKPHMSLGGLRGSSSLLAGGGHAIHSAASGLATYLGQCLTLGQLHTLAGATEFLVFDAGKGEREKMPIADDYSLREDHDLPFVAALGGTVDENAGVGWSHLSLCLTSDLLKPDDITSSVSSLTVFVSLLRGGDLIVSVRSDEEQSSIGFVVQVAIG
ncbi:hypothetical protein FOZ63_011910, partial [Perkinsus olseni]